MLIGITEESVLTVYGERKVGRERQVQEIAGGLAFQHHPVVCLRRQKVKGVHGADAAFLHHRHVGVIQEAASTVPDE